MVKLLWISETVIYTPKEWERINNILIDVSKVTMISIEDCGQAFKQAIQPSISLSEAIGRIQVAQMEMEVEEKEEKFFKRFLPKPIGKQRRR